MLSEMTAPQNNDRKLLEMTEIFLGTTIYGKNGKEKKVSRFYFFERYAKEQKKPTAKKVGFVAIKRIAPMRRGYFVRGIIIAPKSDVAGRVGSGEREEWTRSPAQPPK